MKQLTSCLESSPDMLQILMDEIPDKRLDMIFNGSDWSIEDHVEHLLETQSVFLERLNLFKNEEEPVIKAFFPDNNKISINRISSKRDAVNTLISEFREIRNLQIELIQTLGPDIRRRIASHSEHAYPLSFNRLLQHFLSHDHYHIYRIEELGFFKEENIESW